MLPSPLMSQAASGRRDALEGVERVIVDGSNVLGVLAASGGAASRGASSPGGSPPGAVIGRIRAAIPGPIRVELVFDGPAGGSPIGRVAEGMTVRFAGRRPADAIIVELAATAALGGHPPGANVVVVTDDRALAAQVRRHGVRTLGTGWLTRRLGTPGRPGGNLARPRPPAPSASSGGSGPGATSPPPPGGDDPRDAAAAQDARRWRPGRGATTKTGSARKAPRSARAVEGRPWKRRGRTSG